MELRWRDKGGNHLQSVLPPSKHPETGSYCWINSPSTTRLAVAPDWFLEGWEKLSKKDIKPKKKTASDTNVIISQFLEAEVDTSDDGPHSAGHTTITFQGTPTKGDKLRIFCDGTNYYASGVTQDDAGVALA